MGGRPEVPAGDVLLLFGNRSRRSSCNFLYRSDWASLLQVGDPTGLHCACSREGRSGMPVQDRWDDDDHDI